MPSNPELETSRPARTDCVPGAILVVEDSRDDAMLLKRALGKAGVGVPVLFVCYDGEAIDYLECKPPYDDRRACPLPSLMVLDLYMPRMDGFDLLRWVRQQPRFKKVQMVVFSGAERKADIERAYALGADLVTVKPIDCQGFANR